MTRKAGNWVQGFRFYTKESECPDSFLAWTALHAISSALERRVYTHWGYFKYYPNLYLMFIAPPGARKSTAMRFGKKMLMEIGVPTASDTLSREVLIQQMIERGRSSQALSVTVDEFIHFVQTSGVNMITFLTDIYDSPDNFEYTTLKRGIELIERPYLTLIGGITPSRIEELDPKFIESGLASRMIFSVESAPRFRNALPQITREMLDMRAALVEDLRHIATLEGEMLWDSDASEWFTRWYEREHPAAEDSVESRFKGWMSRKPTHIVRLAQVLSIAESDAMRITTPHLIAAKDLIESTEGPMFRMFGTFGRNPLASDLENIMQDILSTGGMEKGKLIERYRHNLRKDELDEVLMQLEMMGVVKISLKAGVPWVLAVVRK